MNTKNLPPLWSLKEHLTLIKAVLDCNDENKLNFLINSYAFADDGIRLKDEYTCPHCLER